MMLLKIPQRRRGRDRRARAGRGFEVLEDRTLLADGIAPKGGPPITGTVGVALSNVEVASYTITDSSGDPGTKWRAKVDWGDGTAPDKQIVPTAEPDGSYEFLDSHTYTAAGTYTVTVMIAVPGSHKPNDNTVTTTATISQPTLKSIAVTPANPSVPKGETEQFKAIGTFSDKSTLDLTSLVTWASATTSVATITKLGLATAVATGTSTISAKLSGITGSTVMTVTAAGTAALVAPAPGNTPSPPSGPMRPIGPATTSGPDQGIGAAAGTTPSPAPVLVPNPAGTVAPAIPITVQYVGDSMSRPAASPSEVGPTPGLTDHAIGEVARRHQPGRHRPPIGRRPHAHARGRKLALRHHPERQYMQ